MLSRRSEGADSSTQTGAGGGEEGEGREKEVLVGRYRWSGQRVFHGGLQRGVHRDGVCVRVCVCVCTKVIVMIVCALLLTGEVS